MIQKIVKKRLREGNNLWFYEGYLSKAIEKYKEALLLSGDDPIIAFHLATCFWALGDKDEALRYLSIMERRRNLLGKVGKKQLDTLKRKYETESPRLSTDGRPGREFDLERLWRKESPHIDRYTIHRDAFSMGLYSIAGRFAGPQIPLDTDDWYELLDTEDKIARCIERQFGLLRIMRKEMSCSRRFRAPS